MEKIKRDLNSPSAAARLRGQRALKSPTFRKANYELFDVAREEQDIITAEEKVPFKPKTIREIFDKCCIYVEVRAGDDNRSAGIKSRLLADGIKVNEKLYKDTTHVIFKDGLLSTYKQAKKMNIPITTILWIESCKMQRRLVDTEKFKISNMERYENPELFPRMRRQKSMQPEISKQVTLKPKSTTQPSFIAETSLLNETENRTVREIAPMDMTLKEDQSNSSNDMQVSTQIQVNLMSEKKLVQHRRLTSYTPRQMEQTQYEKSIKMTGIASMDRRRRTVFEASHDFNITPTNNGGKKIVFNSANRIASNTRLSVMDISINILELNCEAIRKMSAQKQNEESENAVESIPSSNSNETISNETQIPQNVTIRKRKLFSMDDTLDETYNECKENLDEPKNISKRAKPKENKFFENCKENRRKTISYFKTDKPAAAIKKRDSTPKCIVMTNMSSAEKQELSAVSKLS